MIIGVGTDIVQIPRIERLVEKFGRKFVARILSDIELEFYDNKVCKAYLSRRFAGKEAVAKALGKGIGRPLNFKDITIKNNSLGKPEVIIHKNLDSDLNDINIHISLSDDYPIATAFAVIEKSN